MKFALFRIISCALVVRVAEAVPGDGNTKTKTSTEVHVETNHSSSRKATSRIKFLLYLSVQTIVK